MTWKKGLDALKVERYCTRVEIKPHNKTGISAGVGQLLSPRWARIPNRACRGRPLALYLITYDLEPGDSTRAMIRMLRVTAATAAITGRRGWSVTDLKFQDLDTMSVATLKTLMPKRECPTERGAIMEQAIRIRYAQEMNRRRGAEPPLKLPVKPTSATGPDIDHEYAEFLAELADELLHA